VEDNLQTAARERQADRKEDSGEIRLARIREFPSCIEPHGLQDTDKRADRRQIEAARKTQNAIKKCT